MRKTLIILFLLSAGKFSAYSQIRLTQDAKLEKQVYESGLIHQPLPLDVENSFEANGWKKEVLQSAPLTGSASAEGWSHSGAGSMSFTVSGQGSIKLQFPTSTGKRATGSPSDPDYATYGNAGVTYHLNGANLEKYNRIVFSIYPDCDGARVVNMNLTFVNADTPAKKGYNQPTGSHLINLVNKEWNQCFLEIDEFQRNKVMKISFSTALKGKDRTTGDSAIYYIDNLQLQTVKHPEKVSGWLPAEGKIVYSTTGYALNSPKAAIVNANPAIGKRFQLLTPDGETVYEGNIKEETTTIGRFGLIDFTAFNRPGEYRLKAGDTLTPAFRIGENIWEDSQWRVLNFIFCQRCGHPVPGKHATCHVDLMSEHNSLRLPFNGGWHDAGDLSQQTLQTGDVAFALLEAYNKQKTKNPALAARLREEAEWGVEFIVKNRYGDGYRASSMGLLIWQDGAFNSLDDITSVRVQNMAFDNFLYAGYEAYASMTLDNDPMYQEYLRRVAEEDFRFALEKFKKDGFDKFVQPYEHSYNTSKSQYMATISWAASQLYKLTRKPCYAEAAAEYIRYTLDCQRTEPLKDKDGTCGFFYRDKNKQSIVHYIHQSREQVYMQAMSMLCETQPEHPDYPQWERSIHLYGNYLKGLMKYTRPYGMLPSGVYHAEEYKDTTGFYALHLFPPTNAKELYTEQIKRGIRLDKEHYVKRFPVWFNIFNGNTAIHLSTGKSAAICGNFMKDKELLEIGLEQLYWTVGKNPFGQSLIYGEGRNYPQLNTFSSGEMTGEMPVGIRTLGNDDIPYWPQTNNACYKEVWVTSAGKWLSLIAEY
ncbi:glycoside hydrolase family 9 protein [Bacteroides sp.]|uniref:glycoside hydrolase family 9 protein n=1 Tax=Bacteroides sp. TaxID=29523 RepID=UPI003AB5B86F